MDLDTLFEKFGEEGSKIINSTWEEEKAKLNKNTEPLFLRGLCKRIYPYIYLQVVRKNTKA